MLNKIQRGETTRLSSGRGELIKLYGAPFVAKQREHEPEEVIRERNRKYIKTQCMVTTKNCEQ